MGRNCATEAVEEQELNVRSVDDATGKASPWSAARCSPEEV